MSVAPIKSSASEVLEPPIEVEGAAQLNVGVPNTVVTVTVPAPTYPAEPAAMAATTGASVETVVTTVSTENNSSAPANNDTNRSNNNNNMNNGTETLQEQQTPPLSAEVEAEAKTGKGKSEMDPSLTYFNVLYVVTQLTGITMIILMGTWASVHMGGFGGPSEPSKWFYWHPMLMTIGLIFLYGNSILIYRGFRNTRKKTLKITHAAIHMGAFVLTVIALKAVFDSHNLPVPPIPNMYSLHSWLGLSAVILFCMQYVAGFMAYMVPGLRESYKAAYMPLHIYFGLFGFVLAIASALMGITEKVIFSVPNFSSLPDSGVMINVIGVLYVTFGGLVVYLTTNPDYKRKPIPEDTILLTGESNE